MLNWRDFRPLFMERTKYSTDGWDLSLGRIAFWACFISAMYFWIWVRSDIFVGHLQMLYIMTAYNLAKKAPWLKDKLTPFTAEDNAGGVTQNGDIPKSTFKKPEENPYESPNIRE